MNTKYLRFGSPRRDGRYIFLLHKMGLLVYAIYNNTENREYTQNYCIFFRNGKAMFF
jgi:hypothetical protein